MGERTFDTPFGSTAKRGSVEPLSIVDRRIVFGPRVGELTVDYVKMQLKPKPFNLGYLLAQHVDETVEHPTLMQETYGWDIETLSDADSRRLLHLIRIDVNMLRTAFGDELGDEKWGAIRTVHRVGYQAVSEL